MSHKRKRRCEKCLNIFLLKLEGMFDQNATFKMSDNNNLFLFFIKHEKKMKKMKNEKNEKN